MPPTAPQTTPSAPLAPNPVVPHFGGVPSFLLPLEAQPLVEENYYRGQARVSLAGYCRRVVLPPEQAPALHHLMICSAIDDLLADRYDELIILAPPGSAKSTYTSIGLSAYFMGRWPAKHILTASHTLDLAEKWGRRVRGIVDSAEHSLVFDGSRLSRESAAAGRWGTTAGGEFYAAGVGGSILGFRADLGVIDDPLASFEQAQSETQLAKMRDWYENDFITRMKPGAKVVLICQRLARNDLAGYLIDRNAEKQTRRQHILRLRMEADPALDPIDALGRAPGERLWPEWFTAEMVIDAKRDEYKWRTLYQQEPPSDTGEWVRREDIVILPAAEQPRADDLSMYLMSDLALSINKGDYSVHIAAGVDAHGVVHVVDAWRGRVAVEQTAARHIAMTTEYLPLESLIDDDNAAKVYVQLLAGMSREAGQPVPLKTMPMRGQDKETRNAALRGLFRRGRVRLWQGEWNAWLVKELMLFPNAVGSGVDDGVDALGLIGRRLIALSVPGAAPAAPAPQPTVKQMTLNELWEDRERGRFTFGQGRV